MRFFVPKLKDDRKAEEVWEELRKKNSNDTDKDWQATGRKIFKIWYRHNAQSFIAEVGKTHPEDHQEEIYAIFEAFGPCYLVCTTKRGVFGGGRYYIGKNDTVSVEYFDNENI